MCIKIFPKIASGMHNSYSVTKVLLKHIKIPLSVHVSTTPMQLVVMPKNCTQTGEQRNITLNNTTGEQYLGTKTSTRAVNLKPAAPKAKVSQDILEYLNSKDYLKPVLGYLPQKILKGRKLKADVFYTVDRDVAGKCMPANFGGVTAVRALRFILLLWDFLPSVCSGIPVLRQDL
jgi:hypothetical protein